MFMKRVHLNASEKGDLDRVFNAFTLLLERLVNLNGFYKFELKLKMCIKVIYYLNQICVDLDQSYILFESNL